MYHTSKGQGWNIKRFTFTVLKSLAELATAIILLGMNPMPINSKLFPVCGRQRFTAGQPHFTDALNKYDLIRGELIAIQCANFQSPGCY